MFIKSIIKLVTLAFIAEKAVTNYKEAVKSEEERQKSFSSLNLSEEEGSKIENILSSDDPADHIDYDINFPLELFRDLRFNNTSVDLECLNPLDTIQDNSVPAIHIMQEFDRKHGRNLISILFQIPTGTNADIGAEIRKIKGTYDSTKNESTGGLIERLKQLIDNNVDTHLPKIKSKRKLLEIKMGNYMYAHFLYKDGDGDNSKLVSSTKIENLPKFTKDPFGKMDDVNFNNMRDSEISSYIEKSYTSFDKIKIESSDKRIKSSITVEDVFYATKITLLMRDKFHLDGVTKTVVSKFLEEALQEYDYNKKLYFYTDDEEASVYYEDNDVIKSQQLYDYGDDTKC